MRYIIILLATVLGFSSCKDKGLETWDTKDAIYFEQIDGGIRIDSVSYSFANTSNTEGLLGIHVQLAGDASSVDRSIRLEVEEDMTTAEEGKHFILEDSYVFKANKYRDTIYIKLLNTDPEMMNNIFKLGLKIKANDNFREGINDKLIMKVRFSGDYMEPAVWRYLKSSGWGDYSKVKHKHCVEDVIGRDFPSVTEYWENTNLWNYYKYMCGKYFRENTITDENGNVIQGW